MKNDLCFEKAPEVKCIHCGHTQGNHLANSHHCPMGTRDRVLGFSRFSTKTVFAPKPMRMSAEQLRTANRATLKAFLASHAVVVKTDNLIKLIKQATEVRAEYMARPRFVEL